MSTQTKNEIENGCLLVGEHYAYFPSKYPCIWIINGLTCTNPDKTESLFGVARSPDDSACWLLTLHANGEPDKEDWGYLGNHNTIKTLDSKVIDVVYKMLKI